MKDRMEKNVVKVINHELFGNVRILLGDTGEPLFCGIDVTNALGYSNSRKAIGDHCPNVTKRHITVKTGIKADGNPAIRNLEMSFIPECDVYRLIIRSNMPNAVQFERWLMDDVILSIRKHGAYLTPEKLTELLRDPDALIQICKILKEEQQRRIVVNSSIEHQCYRSNVDDPDIMKE
jgi:anti-repressor protein